MNMIEKLEVAHRLASPNYLATTDAHAAKWRLLLVLEVLKEIPFHEWPVHIIWKVQGALDSVPVFLNPESYSYSLVSEVLSEMGAAYIEKLKSEIQNNPLKIGDYTMNMTERLQIAQELIPPNLSGTPTDCHDYDDYLETRLEHTLRVLYSGPFQEIPGYAQRGVIDYLEESLTLLGPDCPCYTLVSGVISEMEAIHELVLQNTPITMGDSHDLVYHWMVKAYHLIEPNNEKAKKLLFKGIQSLKKTHFRDVGGIIPLILDPTLEFLKLDSPSHQLIDKAIAKIHAN